jgi:hypothetical protein
MGREIGYYLILTQSNPRDILLCISFNLNFISGLLTTYYITGNITTQGFNRILTL